MVEVALATRTAPSQWWGEADATLMTALELLNEQAAAAQKANRRR